MKSKKSLPLSGIRVLDLTRILAGPFCTMKLGDMGAEVIKIEQPGSGDETRKWGPPFINGESAYFLAVNRNKKSLTLDLKSKEGKNILRQLIKTSDVLVENFRAGVMKSLGFSFEDVRKLNAKIIFCSISGYGQRSSRSHHPSYDLIIQGESGLMDVTGFPESSPTKVGISLADVVAGTLAFEGILLALFNRTRTGRGDSIDISLLDGLISFFAYQSQIALSSKNTVSRKGNRHPTITPYETFRTKDGYVNIAVASEGVWKKFCSVIGRKDISEHPYFRTNADRVKNRNTLESILVPIIRKKKSEEWLRIFSAADVPAGKINSVQAALAQKTLQERKTILTIKHPAAGKLSAVGNPIKLLSVRSTRTSSPPLLGEHTEEILRSIGYSSRDIRKLRGHKKV